MKDYLNKFMKRSMNSDERELNALRQVFEETCNSVVENLGEKPFHVRAGLNAAVFDAVMVAYSNQSKTIPPDARERFQRLLEDDEFVGCTKNNTTDDRIVRMRFLKASHHLFKQ